MDQQAEFDEILNDCEEAETRSINEILHEETDLLQAVFDGDIPSAESLPYRIEQALFGAWPVKTPQDIERYLRLSRLHVLINLAGIPTSAASYVEKAYRLGSYREQLKTIEHDIAMIQGRIDMFSSIRGRITQQSRWGKLSDLYDEAVAIADRLWSDDDDIPNRQKMAEYLQTLDGFEGLSDDTLLKRLRPVAKKHGKLLKPGHPTKK